MTLARYRKFFIQMKSRGRELWCVQLIKKAFPGQSFKFPRRAAHLLESRLGREDRQPQLGYQGIVLDWRFPAVAIDVQGIGEAVNEVIVFFQYVLTRE
jgi:hypothetical protein